MNEEDRVKVEDIELVRAVGDHVILGKAFAFVHKRAFEKPALGWVRSLLGKEPTDAVVSLGGAKGGSVPGATLRPVDLASLRLACVTSDKMIYREGRDGVNLLVVDVFAASSDLVVEIALSGAPFARERVALDGNGVGSARLEQLPAGEYAVRLPGETEPVCTFTVAEYKLAALVAELVERRLDGPKLAVRIRLESFGVPVEGAVDLELTDDGHRVKKWRAEARTGIVDTGSELAGAGPHAIQIQVVADPSKTATVPIVGSRAAERELTCFSRLGTEISGSLLPGEGSREVRGIFLTEGAVHTSPLRVERIDATRLRLEAVADLADVKVTIFDPSVPPPRADALDPNQARHPAHVDESYRHAEELFKAGRFAEARALFEEARRALVNPHPNYAYYLACCWAHLGDKTRALSALRAALSDGWSDFDHLAKDDDLAACRGEPAFDAISRRGRRDRALGDLQRGAIVELDVPAPAAVVAVGAFVGGVPWEGWAATIAPAPEPPKVEVPEVCAPGRSITVRIGSAMGGDASVYVIVKDARLPSSDTPLSRLAGRIKSFVDDAGKKLLVGKPRLTLKKAAATSFPRAQPFAQPFPCLSPAMPSPIPEPHPVLFAAAAPAPMPAGAPVPPPAPRAGPPIVPVPAARPAPAPVAPAAPPAFGAAPAPPPPLEAARPREPQREPRTIADEPEVLFAGLIDPRGQEGAIVVPLPDTFADYVIEAFAIRGLDWSRSETRFRAEKITFASLDLPVFVHRQDQATGRVRFGVEGGRARITVLRDGAQVVSQEVDGARGEVSFVAGPGEWEARVQDLATGAADQAARRVDEPGQIRRVARALRLLRPGERIRKGDDPSILSLRVLPGLEKPFTALVDATSDYGHACCEQTAAKLLAGCAMYVMAREAAKKKRAESIIGAGIRRERSMWLRGRGFKMYPESSDGPNEYWGSKAAKYLFDLAMLRPYRELASHVEAGLEMAADAARAHGVTVPPKKAESCEDAYSILLHEQRPELQKNAIGFVRDRTAKSGLPTPPASPHLRGAVAFRAEGAYAAASLLRAGPSDHQRALELTNEIVRDLGEEGRLYSTVDSVAAIALMSELTRANIVGETGASVEVDGRKVSIAEAALLERAEAIASVGGVVPVEVTRIVEERWDAFAAGVQVRIGLERGGRAARAFAAGDAIDLRVAIEDGYKAGDLLWVCLPDALSYVKGGGQVKRFSIDFSGKAEVVVPLAATGIAPSPQRFAACVRNMFEEERAGSPGLLEVAVSEVRAS